MVDVRSLDNVGLKWIYRNNEELKKIRVEKLRMHHWIITDSFV